MTKCAECGRAAEFRITAAARGIIALCIPCAKKLARDLGLPAVANAARDAERRKANLD